MMGMALSTRAISLGRSTGTTVSARKFDFTMPPNGFGLGSGAATGDPQTAPPDNARFPGDNTPPFVGPFPGSTFNNNDTTTSNVNKEITRNFAGGTINSNGNASGPAAPTQPVTAPTGNPMGMGMGGGGPPGGTVTWSTGDEVQVLWIGQSCPGCVISGGMGGMMGGGAGVFSFQQYENLSTSAQARTRSIFGTTPFTWNSTLFGPQPGL